MTEKYFLNRRNFFGNESTALGSYVKRYGGNIVRNSRRIERNEISVLWEKEQRELNRKKEGRKGGWMQEVKGLIGKSLTIS